jgi:hypothetical protein
MFFILIQRVSAIPVISNVSLQPENIWFNENISISLDCSDSTGNITKVYGKLVAPVVSDNLNFNSETDNHYILKLMSFYFDPDKPPKYTFTIYCQNNNNETVDSSISFNVSQINANISSITTPTYVGDIAQIGVYIEKDGTPFYSDEINFNLKLGGQNWTKTSFYDPGKNNWIIKFNAPNVLGTYDLDLEINFNLPIYNPKKITVKSSIEVKDAIEFKILSVDKTEIIPNDIITVSLSASEKDNNIILNKDYLKFQVGSTNIDSDKINISSAGNYFKVKIQMPDLSPNSYDLMITLIYSKYSVTQTIGVEYVIPVSGKFVDSNNKGINVEIKFLVGDTEKKRLVTDGSGSYSGYIMPGNYTIQLVFPQSTLYLYAVKVSEFDDPIKYYFLDNDVTGIKSAGLFIYEFAMSYSKAKILLKYDEKKVTSEKNLFVYRCTEWNSENSICNTNWKEQDATIDTVRNTVTIETDDVSTYIIGLKKSLNLDFSSEKNVFNLKELIKLRGVTRDESGNFVQGVSLSAKINEENINASASSDSNGVFTLEFYSPEEEGFYTLPVKAEKSPYMGYNKTWSFQVVKNRKISLVVPETIKIKKGDKQTLQFSVINIGQADISNLSLSLTGISQDYFTMQNKIDELKTNQEVKVPINFKIPQDATESTLTLTFKVSSGEISNEEIIGFTIFNENITMSTTTDQKTFPMFTFPTAQIALPLSFNDISFAIIFFIISVLIVYIWKRNNTWKTKERKHIKNLLLDIKGEIRRKKDTHAIHSFDQLIKKMKEKNKNE